MNTHYIVQTATANMPGTCWGTYRRVAVLEVALGVERASMISDRAKDVVRVVETWEKLNVGTSSRCAYEVALLEAEALVVKLNTEAVIVAGRAAAAQAREATRRRVIHLTPQRR